MAPGWSQDGPSPRMVPGWLGVAGLYTFGAPLLRVQIRSKLTNSTLPKHSQIESKQLPNQPKPPPKDPSPHPTPATPRHRPPQRPWGGKMRATERGRRAVGARIFPPHGRCGCVCRGVAGVGCGGGSFGNGLGWFGNCFGTFNDV